MRPIRLGIDRLLAERPAWLQSARLGLLANQASVDSRLRHTRDRLLEAGARLTAVFGPQHGYFGELQANMEESDDFTDTQLGIPVFSLYGNTRRPTPAMLGHIDVLVIDLQDVGTRVYTFATTLALCLQAARDHDIVVAVVDRPNPIGGHRVEGNLLEIERRSFVGYFPLPMRHGLTMAEMALLFNDGFGIGAPLEIYPMEGWHRRMLYGGCGLYWVPPSPNLPTFASTQVYPGQVLLEGTNVSEGRGTTTPFHLWGAPYLKPARVLELLAGEKLPGVLLRPAYFRPTFDKWAGRRCAGFHIHLTDTEAYRPYITSLRLLQAVLLTHPDEFSWKQPPYEYELYHLPIEIILGSANLHKQLEAGVEPAELERAWQPRLDEFRELCAPYLLYS
ncbi:MAG: exo-beta-N-acetylmuramidase NamZ domain-containing protein [Syntrophobacteria bacterium]